MRVARTADRLAPRICGRRRRHDAGCDSVRAGRPRTSVRPGWSLRQPSRRRRPHALRRARIDLVEPSLLAVRGRRLGIWTGILPITPTQVADRGRLSAAHHRRPLLRVAVLRRRLDARRAQTAVCHRLLLPRGDALLVGVRTGRIDAQSLRGSQHAQSHRSASNFPSSWYPVAQLRCSSWILRAGLRLALDHAGRREPSSPVKFALGLIVVGIGFAILVPAAAMTRQRRRSSVRCG